MKETAAVLIDLIEAIMDLMPGAMGRPTRKREVVLARRIFYFLMRRQYKERAGYAWLGKHFGQDHATVMHAIRTHKDQVDLPAEEEYRGIFQEVENHFVSTVHEEVRDDKTALINLLHKRYRNRISLEKEINDLERLIIALDRKTLKP